MQNCIPTRKDDIYLEIEKFDKYTFTHCITYEFARRNSNVENILNFLNDLFVLYEFIIYKPLKTYESMLKSNRKFENKKNIENILKDKIYEAIKFHTETQWIIEFEDLTLDNIKQKISKLIKSLTNKLYEDYYVIYKNEFESQFKHAHEIYDFRDNIERDKALTEHVTANEFDKYNNEDNDYFSIFQSLNKNKKEFTFNSIYPKFKTAMRDFTDTKVMLNIKLPLDELIDFITKIKKDYNSKESIIKSKIEQLEDKLNFNNEELKKGKNVNWADMFFIYDYLQYFIRSSSKTQSVIASDLEILLSKYHYVKVKKEENEIKRVKDKKNCEMSWGEALKYSKEFTLNDDEDITEVDFSIPGITPYLNKKTITTNLNKMESYIEGEDPKYKSLIHS
ncbi:MAG: hypothetical protein COA66_13875 [Arcobacter sp.]|nr:MAG: hypothetical protein COA66_13875 [Arcobacter sp.]